MQAAMKICTEIVCTQKKTYIHTSTYVCMYGPKEKYIKLIVKICATTK